MALLTFQDLLFKPKEDGNVVVEFLGTYMFEVERTALESIGKFEIVGKGSSIEFKGVDETAARNGFNALLNEGLNNLTNGITRKKTLYIHRYSGIPLIGTTSFGIIDRNTNMIEVRPLTGCNMNCIFCSVDEGLASRKTSEVVIEEKYLAAEAKKLAEFKGCECNSAKGRMHNRAHPDLCHVIINSQGEPTLYKPLPQLISDLKAIAAVKTITLITNGTLLTEKLIDELAAAGLTMLNISLNAIDPKIAKIMEGHGSYDVEKVKRMAAYAAAKTAIKVTLAPVIVGNYNDSEMEKIVAFAKEIGATTAMQNYLFYRKGRNPGNAQQMPWPKFYSELESLEEKYGSKLVFSAADYKIIKTRPLPKPFRKGQTVKATVISEGRYPKELIAAAEGRIITLPDCDRNLRSGEKIKIKIVSDKHNIFYGKVA
ncbi:radical SAM protein [Candidatus Woesearchaeota archaeon]|nr:radical SAM protein [Candidatus Woesearchaeota archaeon]